MNVHRIQQKRANLRPNSDCVIVINPDDIGARVDLLKSASICLKYDQIAVNKREDSIKQECLNSTICANIRTVTEVEVLQRKPKSKLTLEKKNYDEFAVDENAYKHDNVEARFTVVTVCDYDKIATMDGTKVARKRGRPLKALSLIKNNQSKLNNFLEVKAIPTTSDDLTPIEVHDAASVSPDNDVKRTKSVRRGRPPKQKSATILGKNNQSKLNSFIVKSPTILPNDLITIDVEDDKATSPDNPYRIRQTLFGTPKRNTKGDKHERTKPNKKRAKSKGDETGNDAGSSVISVHGVSPAKEAKPPSISYRISQSLFTPKRDKICDKIDSNKREKVRKKSKSMDKKKDRKSSSVDENSSTVDVKIIKETDKLTVKSETTTFAINSETLLIPNENAATVVDDLSSDSELVLAVVRRKWKSEKLATTSRQTQSDIKKKVRFSNDVLRHSPPQEQKFQRTTSSRSLDSDSGVPSRDSPPLERNVFNFMMDARNKVIGLNSPGKDQVPDGGETKVRKSCLTARRKLLEDWNERKGGAKRKLTDAQDGELIDEAMNKRTKRLKTLLQCDESNDENENIKCDNNVDANGESSTSKVKPSNKVHMLQQSLLFCINSKSESTQNSNEIAKSDSTHRRSKLSLKAKPLKKDDDVIEDPTLMQDEPSSPILRRGSRTRKTIQPPVVEIGDDESTKRKVSTSQNDKVKKKDVKLASVFLKAIPKPIEDPSVAEARRSFLYSSSPILKKRIDAARTSETIELDNDPFTTIPHVCQEDESACWQLPEANLDFVELDGSIDLRFTDFPLGVYTNSQMTSLSNVALRRRLSVKRKKHILGQIKKENFDYPVYLRYKLLRATLSNTLRVNLSQPSSIPTTLHDTSCIIIDSDSDCSGTVRLNENDVQTMLWTEKYRPTRSAEIVGNRAGAQGLYAFLKDWLESSSSAGCSQGAEKKRKKHRRGSIDDFLQDSDGESVSSGRMPGNCIVLRGPHGSGKTSTVYAVCQELDVNVIELNASSKRTGKQLLQKLQEATQSKQIHMSASTVDSEACAKMAVLLVEDIDVVFDNQDDLGFIAALCQLLQTSKRPIILTLTDCSVMHTQRFLNSYKVLTFLQLSARTCAIWLQLVCLLEDIYVNTASVGALLEANGGDLRRTLNQLQFWAVTGGDAILKSGHGRLERSTTMLRRISHMDESFVVDDGDTSEVDESLSMDSSCTYQHQNCSDLVLPSVDLENSHVTLGQLWWNSSLILGREFRNPAADGSPDICFSPMSLKSLEDIFGFYEAMSVADCHLNDPTMEPVPSQHWNGLKDSLSLEEEQREADFHECLMRDSVSFMLQKSYARLVIACDAERGVFDRAVPGTKDRRKRVKMTRCLDTLTNDFLPLTTSLSRKAVATDYFPSLVAICKSEKVRLEANVKRSNRFYSYMRTLGLNCSESVLKTVYATFKCSQ